MTECNTRLQTQTYFEHVNSNLLLTDLSTSSQKKYSLTHLLKSSQPANLTTYTILSLFSLQVELAPRLLSP